jgi:hypothetical protein
LSKLTNLEELELNGVNNLNDAAVLHYSTLTMINSIKIEGGFYLLTGLGLSCLVANKNFLVELSLCRGCSGISPEGYHCLSSLIYLTKLTLMFLNLDDMGLNLICSSCIRLESLIIYNGYTNSKLTVEGLNSIHCLSHLNSLTLTASCDRSLAKLSHNTALTNLLIDKGKDITYEGLSHLSNLVRLRSLTLLGCKNITDISAAKGKFAFPIHIISIE